MKKILAPLFALAILASPFVAFAQDAGSEPAAPTVAPSPDDLGGFIGEIVKAVGMKDWRVLGAMICIALVWVARKFLGPKIAWFRTDRGGAVLALAMGLLASAGEILFTKDPWAWSMIGSWLAMSLTAAGGFSIWTKLTKPSDQK